MGPAVFLGSPPTLKHSWSLLECTAPWPLLAVWDRGFPGLTANPHTLGPSWSVRHHVRSSQCGTRGFPGLTANPQHFWSLLETAPGHSSVWDPGLLGLTAKPQHTLVPRGVCGSMAAPRSVGPAVFSGSPPTLKGHTTWSLVLESAAPGIVPPSVGPVVFPAHRQPTTLFGPTWSVRLLARSLQSERRIRVMSPNLLK